MLPSTDTDVTGAAAQLSALKSSGALLELERMLAAARQDRVRGLEQLAASPALAELERMLAEVKSRPVEPDLLGIVGVEGIEGVHSNFLAWLLDPTANHGFGDYYLKQFLRATAAQSDAVPAAVANADWSQASVRREWYALVDGSRGYLDILVVNQSAPILCAIENKVFSPESVGQLSHYRKALENDYPGFVRHLVFLSPEGRLSEETTEREVWIPADYKTVHNLVEQTVADNADRIIETAHVILQQYAATLRRSIVPELNESADLQQLARQIYMEHREAIELIYRHRPDYIGEAKSIFRQEIAAQPGWSMRNEEARLLKFIPVSWDGFDGFKTGSSGDTNLMWFEVDFRQEYPGLGLVLSPGKNETIREKLHRSTLNRPDVFRGCQARLTSSWTWLYWKVGLLDDIDYNNWADEAAIRSKITDAVCDFVANEFPAMNEVIVNCLRDYASEQAQQSGQ